MAINALGFDNVHGLAQCGGLADAGDTRNTAQQSAQAGANRLRVIDDQQMAGHALILPSLWGVRYRLWLILLSSLADRV